MGQKTIQRTRESREVKKIEHEAIQNAADHQSTKLGSPSDPNDYHQWANSSDQVNQLSQLSELANHSSQVNAVSQFQTIADQSLRNQTDSYADPVSSDGVIQRVVTETEDGRFHSSVTGETYPTSNEAELAEALYGIFDASEDELALGEGGLDLEDDVEFVVPVLQEMGGDVEEEDIEFLVPVIQNMGGASEAFDAEELADVLVDQQPAQDPKATFLANASQMDMVNQTDMEGFEKLWDLGDAALRNRISEVMGNAPGLRRLSTLEYFLEAINPSHLGYTKIRNIFRFWTQGVLYHGWAMSFVEWSPGQEESTTHIGETRRIEYYDEVEREQYRLTPNGKKILKHDGSPLVGDNIYVLSGGDVLYGGTKDGPVHHSSFLAGAPVKCAGHLFTDGTGNLQSIDNSSGHYAPTQENLKNAVRVLDAKMDLSDCNVGAHGGGEGQSVADFLNE